MSRLGQVDVPIEVMSPNVWKKTLRGAASFVPPPPRQHMAPFVSPPRPESVGASRRRSSTALDSDSEGEFDTDAGGSHSCCALVFTMFYTSLFMCPGYVLVESLGKCTRCRVSTAWFPPLIRPKCVSSGAI